MKFFYLFLRAQARGDLWWANKRLELLSEALDEFRIDVSEYADLRKRIEREADLACDAIQRWDEALAALAINGARP